MHAACLFVVVVVVVPTWGGGRTPPRLTSKLYKQRSVFLGKQTLKKLLKLMPSSAALSCGENHALPYFMLKRRK